MLFLSSSKFSIILTSFFMDSTGLSLYFNFCLLLAFKCWCEAVRQCAVSSTCDPVLDNDVM